MLFDCKVIISLGCTIPYTPVGELTLNAWHGLNLEVARLL